MFFYIQTFKKKKKKKSVKNAAKDLNFSFKAPYVNCWKHDMRMWLDSYFYRKKPDTIYVTCLLISQQQNSVAVARFQPVERRRYAYICTYHRYSKISTSRGSNDGTKGEHFYTVILFFLFNFRYAKWLVVMVISCYSNNGLDWMNNADLTYQEQFPTPKFHRERM